MKMALGLPPDGGNERPIVETSGADEREAQNEWLQGGEGATARQVDESSSTMRKA